LYRADSVSAAALNFPAAVAAVVIVPRYFPLASARKFPLKKPLKY
jgi:hypothetical protein